MISLTIDGKTVEVTDGTTVLRAAESVGIQIPKLCDHPALPPYGGCRLCVVEVQGFRTPIASCTLPTSQGMVVTTNSEKLSEIREFILSMLFSERNHFCPFCQKTGGDCELQNAAYHEEMTHWPIQPNWTPFQVDASHPRFIFDHNRCILCRRCVRACANMAGNFTLDVENRGARTLIVADYGLPIGESTCIQCGSCVQACPTGALIERNSAYQGLEKDAQSVKSLCVGCSVGCGITALVRDNRIIRIIGDWDSPVNQGVLCKLGRYEAFEDNRQRITVPMVRKESGLVPASWAEALTTVARKLESEAANGHKIAALISSRLPAEDLYLFKQLFSDILKSKMVTGIEENLTSGGHPLAGITDKSLFGDFDDLKKSDCVLIIGADLVKNHEVAGFFIKRNRPQGVSIILLDPFENQTESVANYVLHPKQGTDSQVLTGILSGVTNLGFNRISQPSKPGTGNDPQALHKTAAVSGIPVETLLAVSRELGTAKSPMIVYGKGLTGAVDFETNILPILMELAHATGSQLINTLGKANSLAASTYGLNIPFEPTSEELVYLVLGDDYATSRLIQRIPIESSLILQTSYTSPLLDRADVVLPMEIWTESSGHYLNMEGRLQESNCILKPISTLRSNKIILEDIAARLGVEMKDNGAADWWNILKKSIAA